MYHTVSFLRKLPTLNPTKPVVLLLSAVWLGLALTDPSYVRAQSVPDTPDIGRPVGEQSAGNATVSRGQEIRTVNIEIQRSSFDRKIISVTAGETIRFVIRNRGDRPHDFTLGTPQVQKARRVLLLRGTIEAQLLGDATPQASWPDAPTAVVVAPGETKEILWQFNRSRDVEFGCNIPSHYEPGMKGRVSIEAEIHQEKVADSNNRQLPQTAVLPRKKPMRTSASGSGDATLTKPRAPRARLSSKRRRNVSSLKRSRIKRRILRRQKKTSVNYNLTANDDSNDYDARVGEGAGMGGMGGKGGGSD